MESNDTIYHFGVKGMNAVKSLLKDKDVVSAALYSRQANRYRKGLVYYRDISS